VKKFKVTEALSKIFPKWKAIFDSHEKTFTQAFRHRSSVKDGSLDHNERLEYLGDAVLELVVTESLFTRFSREPEGILTAYRSALVKKENLAAVAKKLTFGDLMILSRGEEASGGRTKDYLLANTMEAFIGALYIAAGIEKTADFIHAHITSALENILAENAHRDAKSDLQELTQGKFTITPKYQVLQSSGKDHEKKFIMGVFLKKILLAKGSGGSKKEGELDAAKKALETQETWIKKF